MRCVTFSNVLYVFELFMNNQLGHVYISALVSGFASVTEIPGGGGGHLGIFWLGMFWY